jgi:hypothetical protein
MRGSIDRMRAFVAALCLLAGCDYVFRIDRVPLIDGGISDGNAGDAAADAAQSSACQHDSPVLILPDVSVTDPSQRADQLELYMARLENGNYNIYVSIRSDIDSAWSLPQHVTALSSQSDDMDPALAGGGLRIFLTSNRSGARALYQATRSSLTSSWGTPTSVGTGGAYVGGFDVSPDGRTLYADDGQNNALRRLTRASDTADFGGAGTLASGVGYPSLTGDQLKLYYHRAGTIYRQTRTGLTGGFSKEEIVAAGSDPDISEDGTSLIFKTTAGLAKITCQ